MTGPRSSCSTSRSPDGSAYECCRALRERFGQGLPIVLISQHRVEPSDEVAGLLLGADEYLAKPLNPDVFAARVAPPAAARAVAHEPGLPADAARARGARAAGRRREPANQIAKQLCITEKTTSTHIERILAKLGAHSRAQAVAFAVRDRLVEAAA